VSNLASFLTSMRSKQQRMKRMKKEKIVSLIRGLEVDIDNRSWLGMQVKQAGLSSE